LLRFSKTQKCIESRYQRQPAVPKSPRYYMKQVPSEISHDNGFRMSIIKKSDAHIVSLGLMDSFCMDEAYNINNFQDVENQRSIRR